MITATFGKKAARRMSNALREIRDHATMKHMSVGQSAFVGNIPLKMQDGTLVTEKNLDDFCRERLRIHHSSWIVEPLDELIAALNNYAEGKPCTL